MSGARNDGGPAFPFASVSQNQATGETTVTQGDAGMTLRDYFAIKAVPALLALCVNDDRSGSYEDHIAISAYAMADAMLKVRA